MPYGELPILVVVIFSTKCYSLPVNNITFSFCHRGVHTEGPQSPASGGKADSPSIFAAGGLPHQCRRYASQVPAKMTLSACDCTCVLTRIDHSREQ